MSLRHEAPGQQPAVRDRMTGPALEAAAVAMGLSAGVYFAFDVAVMPAMKDLDDRTFVEVWQRIDDAIQNPIFFASFFGAPGLTAVAVYLQRRRGRGPGTRWTVAALGFALVAFVVTIAANVPLNEDLVNAGDPGTVQDLATVRKDFEGPWVAWNMVRTVASTAALACLGRALVLHRRAGR